METVMHTPPIYTVHLIQIRLVSDQEKSQLIPNLSDLNIKLKINNNLSSLYIRILQEAVIMGMEYQVGIYFFICIFTFF